MRIRALDNGENSGLCFHGKFLLALIPAKSTDSPAAAKCQAAGRQKRRSHGDCLMEKRYRMMKIMNEELVLKRVCTSVGMANYITQSRICQEGGVRVFA